ncbi:hypothetical protein BFF78_41975 [Streptomyces fodineus]|uniref:STAS domain-containing protein n=1 Tax=Streptomyces fodineus TaxID=1904616 RepID=A0A1D7YMY4_9ACTN|nr:STAS domain-containing protein [Streptomyces fodineus]AOR36749.1 hypothetical protein BFF78_41975 [Streptomyces fodineus]
MVLSRLDIHRRNRGEQALVTLAGTIGPATVPLLRAALEQCLRDGVTVIDIDLTTVNSCDSKGLDVFLGASHRAGRVHASLQLHHPCAQITRLLSATGSTLLLAPPPVPRHRSCSATSRVPGRGRLMNPLVGRISRPSRTGSVCAG